MSQIIPSFKNTHFRLGGVAYRDNCANLDSSAACNKFISKLLGNEDVFFTKSCTQSLEMAIMILNLPAQSEVIIPSYGFVSLANSVAMFGHKCVFVDCELDTLNISSEAIEAAVTHKTKAVITINYGGIPCDYMRITEICKENDLWLIEDNAHGLLANLHGTQLGSFGDISTFSFDSLKMITSFEGGALVINNKSLIGSALSCANMGTNRSDFRKGKAPCYQWTSLGTNAALAKPLYDILEEQFNQSANIVDWFVRGWKYYYANLKSLSSKHGIRLPRIKSGVNINGYIFWITTRSNNERMGLISQLQAKGITLSPHYSALHLSEYGKANHSFSGSMQNTEIAATQMVRLPLFYGITQEEQKRVVFEIEQYYAQL